MEDIDFKLLEDDKIFEELCFDLILKLGFVNICWRQGGADNGRDIEAERIISDSLVETYNEKWFFECKHHSAGINPEHINSKVVWADSERPKHLVIITSTYLTNNCRLYLDNIRLQNKYYKIHVIEGKILKEKIKMFDDLKYKYFSNPAERLLREFKNNWLVHRILPNAEVLYNLSCTLNIFNLSASDSIFLKYSYFNC